MKKVITFGRNATIEHMNTKDYTLSVDAQAKMLGKAPVSVFKYSVYNYKTLSHAIVALPYWSKEYINMVTLALYNDIKVAVMLPDNSTFRFEPGDVVEYKAHNVMRKELRNQAIRWSKQEDNQLLQDIENEVKEKLNNLYSPRYYTTLATKVLKTQNQIITAMKELGYSEDRLPEVFVPSLRHEDSCKYFINLYANLYDMSLNNAQDEAEDTIDLFNRYGGGSGSWKVKQHGTVIEVDKESGSGYVNMYAREPRHIAPDYTTMYAILYYMANDIMPEIEPPFETESYDDYEYRLSKEVED